MRALLLASFVTLISSTAVLAACSDDESSPPANGPSTGDDAGSGSDGSSGSPDASTAKCNTMAQQGQSVDILVAKPPIPDAKGGIPAAGSYVLTSGRAFTELLPEGNKAVTFGAYTIEINGTAFKQVITDAEGVVTHADGTLTVDGTSFTATSTCEEPAPEQGPTVLAGKYTAESDKLLMYVVRDLGITAELTFEKK